MPTSHHKILIKTKRDDVGIVPYEVNVNYIKTKRTTNGCPHAVDLNLALSPKRPLSGELGFAKQKSEG